MPGSKLKKILKIAALSMGAVLLTLVVLELFFRLTEVAWKPVYQTLFDNPDKIYVYVLGESTAEGVQYHNKISPAILMAHQFNNRIDNKEVEIISLAHSGTNAEYMYFRFYFNVLFAPHRNGLVLTYSGINEGIENNNAYKFKWWKMAQRSVVLSKLMFMSGRYGNDFLRYEYRYRQTCRLAKKHNYKVVLSQLVGNIKDYDPDVPEGNGLLTPGHNKTFTEANRLFYECKFTEAKEKYRELLHHSHTASLHLWFRIARCEYELGNYAAAAELFNRLPEGSNYCGFARWKNTIIEKVAAEENVAVAKVFDRFCDSSEHRLVGHNLINDAHHPNLKGYCIMAEAISAEVSKLYREPVHASLSPEAVAAHFKFNSAFYAGVYYQLTEWYIFKAFDTEVRDVRLEKINQYFISYAKLKPKDEILVLWKLMIAVLRNDKTRFAKTLLRFHACKQKEELVDRFEKAFCNERYSQKILRTIAPWQFEDKTEAALKQELISRLQ